MNVLWALVQAIRDHTAAIRDANVAQIQLRTAVDLLRNSAYASNLAISKAADSIDREAQAIEQLAATPPVPATAEITIGTRVPE